MLREDLGFGQVLTKEEKQKADKLAKKIKSAKKAIRRNDFAGAAARLLEDDEDLIEEPAATKKPVKAAGSSGKADDIIGKLDEAVKAKTTDKKAAPTEEKKADAAEAAEPAPVKEEEPAPVKAEESVPAEKPVVAEKSEEQVSEPKPQREAPTRPPVIKSCMNPDLDFYNHRLGNMAYRFDAGLDEMPAKELHDYVKSVIARDADIIGEIVKDYLPDIIGNNPKMIPSIMQMIEKAEDQNIPIKAFFVNARDPKSKEFSTWEEATASIEELTTMYGIRPENVFTVIWREVDIEGNVGKKISEKKVQDYVAKYHGDKDALKEHLKLTRPFIKRNKPAENSGA